MAPKFTARQARALFKKAKATSEKTIAAKATGACYIIRSNPRTKVLCQKTSPGECNWIDAKLQAEGAGHARFIPGGDCSG